MKNILEKRKLPILEVRQRPLTESAHAAEIVMALPIPRIDRINQVIKHTIPLENVEQARIASEMLALQPTSEMTAFSATNVAPMLERTMEESDGLGIKFEEVTPAVGEGNEDLMAKVQYEDYDELTWLDKIVSEITDPQIDAGAFGGQLSETKESWLEPEPELELEIGMVMVPETEFGQELVIKPLAGEDSAINTDIEEVFELREFIAGLRRIAVVPDVMPAEEGQLGLGIANTAEFES